MMTTDVARLTYTGKIFEQVQQSKFHYVWTLSEGEQLPHDRSTSRYSSPTFTTQDFVSDFRWRADVEMCNREGAKQCILAVSLVHPLPDAEMSKSVDISIQCFNVMVDADILLMDDRLFRMRSEPVISVDELRNGTLTTLREYVVAGVKPSILINILITRMQPDDPPNNLSKDMRALFVRNFLPDVTLVIGTITFDAHKCVLAARSPVFEKIFGSDATKLATNRVFIQEGEHDAWLRFLMYLYSGDVDKTTDLKLVMKLLKLAITYHVASLRVLCIRRGMRIMEDDIENSNAVDLLIFSDLLRDTETKRKTIEYVIEHKNTVFNSAAYRSMTKCHPNLLHDIFQVMAEMETEQLMETY